MGQVLHGSATTTEAVRRAIQHSQASLRALAKRYGINQKTVAKWKKRTVTADLPTGPKDPEIDGAVGRGGSGDRRLPPAHAAAAGRLPLCPAGDDSAPDALFAASLPATPRHLPSAEVEGDKPASASSRATRSATSTSTLPRSRPRRGKLYLLVAIDRTTKFAFVELHQKATRRIAADFLRHLAATVPYKIHTVLTDNGTHFTDPTGDGWTPGDIKKMQAGNQRFLCHAFEFACAELDVEHRLTKPRHPRTNGHVERMNRTIKDATVKRYHSHVRHFKE